MKKIINTNNQSVGYSYIQVMNNSGFVSRFVVKYILEGELKTEQSSDFTLLQSDKIYIPNEAMLVSVKIEEEAFIGVWKMFYITSFVRPVTKCFSLTGDILTPVCTQVPCVEENYKVNNCKINSCRIKSTNKMC